MRYSHPAALMPPAQAEALYDLALDEEELTLQRDDVVSTARVAWPHPASGALAPRRVLSESLARRSSVFQTNRKAR